MPASAVPLQFDGASGYLVRATTGGVTVSCTTPCTLRLVPGPVDIEVVGYFTDSVVVPNHAAKATVSFKKKGFLITGIVLASIGAVTILAGAQEKQTIESADYTGSLSTGDATAVMGVGAVLLVGGVALSIPGFVTHTRVSIEPETRGAAWQKALASLRVGAAPRRGGALIGAWVSF